MGKYHWCYQSGDPFEFLHLDKFENSNYLDYSAKMINLKCILISSNAF